MTLACTLYVSMIVVFPTVLPCMAFLYVKVYMGGELGERPKQGLVTQTLSKIVMSFAKQVRCRRLDEGEDKINAVATNQQYAKEQANRQATHPPPIRPIFLAAKSSKHAIV